MGELSEDHRALLRGALEQYPDYASIDGFDGCDIREIKPEAEPLDHRWTEEERQYGPDVLEIAELEDGDALVVDLTLPGPPVLHWQHDTFEDDDPFVPVAATPEELVQRLRAVEDGDDLPDAPSGTGWIDPDLKRRLDAGEL